MRLTPGYHNSAIDTPAARVERGVGIQQHFFKQLDLCPDLPRFINAATEVAHTFCSYHHDNGVSPADLIPAYDKCLRAWEVFNDGLAEGTEINRDILFAQYVVHPHSTTRSDDADQHPA
jgi:hypothetical protein